MSAPRSRRSRRLAGLAGLLGTAVLLVAGKAATAPPPVKVALGKPHSAATPPPARGSRSAAPAAPAAPSSGGGATGTFLGQPEDVGYGIVQVRLTMAKGRITDVQAVQMPSGGRSSDIASFAAPQLRTEVLAAQSAQIDTVSGASFDSQGYAQSVQSALDSAPR
jgi:uncharacterized protein with FMN-binding domain